MLTGGFLTAIVWARVSSVEVKQWPRLVGLSLTGCTSTPPSRQSVQCPVCGRLISQRRNLNQHLRTHQTASTDEGSMHSEAPQVTVLPVDNVQIRYGRSSKVAIIHQLRPLQVDDVGNGSEVIVPESVMMT
ncbi:hypothetical protein C0J52_15808 [Blattella germanica]|nr:hypothetical protein C0J52_15808 [Blattella germanica]